MQTMITLSLLLNVGVLIPVCFGLLTSANWVGSAYGAPSEARSILLSVYLSILLVSALLLVISDPKLVIALLLVQVLYKLTTPLTVGSFGNPVVVSNVFIAMVHAITLATIWRSSS
ncbi:hypothetical protein SLH49_17330 [Cognatiyoonia sp. IB215446]|uniref:hypothetical protein n=1 Tax=Cognatiyoonia sp. IB215446 TaxID=3097355 RepID=UPI002A0C557C|nr:hypothetical protein [Cognatiyoonia sp. IB215446]MDX8349750.1 hypothetical protein [Cognatiyoonia sp. IB215446]